MSTPSERILYYYDLKIERAERYLKMLTLRERSAIEQIEHLKEAQATGMRLGDDMGRAQQYLNTALQRLPYAERTLRFSRNERALIVQIISGLEPTFELLENNNDRR